MASMQRPANAIVVTKIEKVFEGIAESLLREQEIHIELKIKKRASVLSGPPIGEPSDTLTRVSFPARTPQEGRRFTVLLRILTLIYEALCSNEVVSKRNIYYKDPALFGSQSVVDKYVDIFAYTFGVERSTLNVTAAAKGLIAGEYSLIYSDGTAVHHNAETPRLIDDTTNVQRIDMLGANWILVIEKESTFRTLASSRLDQTSKAGKGIVLTAKGYPDLSTRAFLHLISIPPCLDSPAPQIYVFTDFDPDGIAIMSTYKHGSLNLSHENSHSIVPHLQWLGIKTTDIMNGTSDAESHGLLRLSARDRRKAIKMLENSSVFREEGEEPHWREELQTMLMLNMKAEMEILSEREGGVLGWVEGKLLEQSMFSTSTEEDSDEMII